MGIGQSSEKLYQVPQVIKEDDDMSPKIQEISVDSNNKSTEPPKVETPRTSNGATLYKVPSVTNNLDNTHHEPPHYWDEGVPTVFAWNKGGKNVFLAGNFNEWKEKIQMKQSRNDFFSIQNLAPGIYEYRFIVDGKWEVDPTQPFITDNSGTTSNFVEVKPPDQQNDSLASKPVVHSSPPGEYGHFLYNDSTFSDSPPGLPPHLLRALLNTAPPHADPQLLPLPHHVMLNHLYRIPRIEEKMLIVGVTSRYKSKFVTTVFYQPLENENPNVQTPQLSPSPLILSSDSSDQLQQLTARMRVDNTK